MTENPYVPNQELELLRRLIEISRQLTSTFDLDILLDRIVHAAVDLCDAEAASILLYDENKGQLFFQATTNLESSFIRGLHVPVDRSIAGWIVTHREPIIIADTQNDPRYYTLIEKATSFKTHSMLGVPMITKEKVVGVVQTLNKQQGTFDEKDQDTLMALAAQAAVAIENTRLFHQSDLIAEMVHELRTPMGSLNAATHLLMRPEITSEQHDKMVMIIQAETRRLSDMASSFLDLARLESGRIQFYMEKFEPVPLLAECTGITNTSMLERNIELNWQVPQKLPHIFGDREKLKQVFLNLLSNAVKYNQDGGQVSVSAAADDEEVLVSIADTGPGIPAESMPQLFKKFYRVPGTENTTSGTGLGLSICKKILDTHGGYITVESIVGEGSSFTVHMPIRPDAR